MQDAKTWQMSCVSTDKINYLKNLLQYANTLYNLKMKVWQMLISSCSLLAAWLNISANLFC